MDNFSDHVLTLANSIIGVSVLAMPYCFKQCGIILSIFILFVSSIISRLACHFLLKSAILARRKTFEFLAFHIFGSLGKFVIEIGIIGFLLGTCIAFFVVMGDLAPDIVAEITGGQVGFTLRNSILIFLAIFCVLPMGLLKNVDSLNAVSKATIGFYCCLVIKIIIEALPHLFTGYWLENVVFWRPEGILQCLPIFSMALFCQTQIFEIYQVLPNASLEKMNGLIRVAINMCIWVYILVGTFGYIAFSQGTFTGNVLLSFQPSILTNVFKLGFILSLAFSFPLVIFPCRASLYSLLYKGQNYTSLHESNVSNYIPKMKFTILTLFIVVVSLFIGIAIPNIELVLGLVGSTIGVLICVIFPVTCFIWISPKNTNERLLAELMLCIGIIVMVLGTYANMYAYEMTEFNIPTERNLEVEKKLIENDKLNNIVKDILANPDLDQNKNYVDMPNAAVKVQPTEHVNVNINLVTELEIQALLLKTANKPSSKPPELSNNNKKLLITPSEGIKENIRKQELPLLKNKKNNLVDSEAIKHHELKEEEAAKQADSNQLLIDTLKKQNEIQQEIVEQNKKLIEVIEKQQDLKVNVKKLKAFKKIKKIAKKSINSISEINDEKKVNDEINLEKNVRLANDTKNYAIKNKLSESLPLVLVKLNNANKIKVLSTPKIDKKLKAHEDLLETNKSIYKQGDALKNIVGVVNENLNRDKEILRRKRETIDAIQYKTTIRQVCNEIGLSLNTKKKKTVIKILCKLLLLTWME